MSLRHMSIIPDMSDLRPQPGPAHGSTTNLIVDEGSIFYCRVCSFFARIPTENANCPHIFCEKCVETLEKCPIETCQAAGDWRKLSSLALRDAYYHTHVRCPVSYELFGPRSGEPGEPCRWEGPFDRHYTHFSQFSGPNMYEGRNRKLPDSHISDVSVTHQIILSRADLLPISEHRIDIDGYYRFVIRTDMDKNGSIQCEVLSNPPTAFPHTTDIAELDHLTVDTARRSNYAVTYTSLYVRFALLSYAKSLKIHSYIERTLELLNDKYTRIGILGNVLEPHCMGDEGRSNEVNFVFRIVSIDEIHDSEDEEGEEGDDDGEAGDDDGEGDNGAGVGPDSSKDSEPPSKRVDHVGPASSLGL